MKSWEVGDRVVWPHEVKMSGRYVMVRTAGTVTEVDPPGLPPGVEVTFDRPGVTPTCYATHGELEPEDLQASRVSEQATDHHQES